MRVYLFQAALLCEACGVAQRAELDAYDPPTAPEDESSYDSDDYPKGPYGDGGGESDCPQHCDHCGTFLENALTRDGVAYVAERLEDTRGVPSVLKEWREFYADQLKDLERERAANLRQADNVDGYDRDDIGESPDC